MHVEEAGRLERPSGFPIPSAQMSSLTSRVKRKLAQGHMAYWARELVWGLNYVRENTNAEPNMHFTITLVDSKNQRVGKSGVTCLCFSFWSAFLQNHKNLELSWLESWEFPSNQWRICFVVQAWLTQVAEKLSNVSTQVFVPLFH